MYDIKTQLTMRNVAKYRVHISGHSVWSTTTNRTIIADNNHYTKSNKYTILVSDNLFHECKLSWDLVFNPNGALVYCLAVAGLNQGFTVRISVFYNMRY